MIRVIKDLQREMKELKKAGQGAVNSAQKNGDKKKRVRKNTTKYCWSHGCVRMIAWTAAGRRPVVKIMQPLDKRQVGVLSGVTDG